MDRPGFTRSSRTFAALAMVAVLMAGCAPPSRPTYIHDEDGRIVIYHGVNVASHAKSAPDHLSWHTREDLARLRDWGFNHVRYLVFWEAIEPEDGVFDEVYMANTLERLRWLDELGIDVIVDLHQDLYGQRFGSHGFPDWATDDGGREYVPKHPWNVNYFQTSMWGTFDNFWRSDEIKARYVAMVEYLMGKIEGVPGVVGLDIMNEPWPSYGLLFERKFLSGFYEDIQAMRRRNGFTTPLFFEPIVTDTMVLPSTLVFKPDPGSVYYPHYYDPFGHEGLPYGPLGRVLLGATVKQRVRDAHRFGTALMFGEFGIADTTSGSGAFLEDFIALMNEYHLGWTYWSYDKGGPSSFCLVQEDGTPNPKLSHLVYVYPQRIAGRNPDIEYDDTTFTLRYDPIDTSAPTVVFVPPSLTNVRVTVNGAATDYHATAPLIVHAHGADSSRQELSVQWQ
ncbi:MAG TPA: cellulase family glycosylhydrolase [Candidatus Hydrogenedentes bacterium]|nr:cellulase family glycosylhydrolase [Candidatus Hydrogenedentota bacterium]